MGGARGKGGAFSMIALNDLFFHQIQARHALWFAAFVAKTASRGEVSAPHSTNVWHASSVPRYAEACSHPSDVFPTS